MPWFPTLIAVAAVAGTCLFCVRPALRGRCAMGRPQGTDAETSRQLAELQEELRAQRAQGSLDRKAGSRRVTPDPEPD